MSGLSPIIRTWTASEGGSMGFRTLIVLITILLAPSAEAQEEVDLELVLLADASSSIDNAEVLFQRRGYAAAITHPEVLKEFQKHTGFDIVSFQANQTVNGERLPIYHTNVMMCLGEEFALICAQSIDDELEKSAVIRSFENTGKEVIFITEEQKERFAGNMLQVLNDKNERYIVMSESAFKSLDEAQKDQLSKHDKLLYSSLDTIECLGGGSARCMMAEVFLPKK